MCIGFYFFVTKPHVTFVSSLLCKRLFFCLILCQSIGFLVIEEAVWEVDGVCGLMLIAFLY